MTGIVEHIVEGYTLLSPLNATQNRMISRFVEGGNARMKKEYRFNSTYDYVEVTAWTDAVQAFNVDGELIEGRFAAYDSSIGSTRLFETWEDASGFARMRCGSQRFLLRESGL